MGEEVKKTVVILTDGHCQLVITLKYSYNEKRFLLTLVLLQPRG